VSVLIFLIVRIVRVARAFVAQWALETDLCQQRLERWRWLAIGFVMLTAANSIV
jgi:hypothetical protein